jgi:adenylyltransferase/sulfurtransferase
MVRQIEPRSLMNRMTEGKPVHLLDVRKLWEHKAAALPNSQLIPLSELHARAREVQPHADALLVVYCHHGIRSLSAATLLEHLGFNDVVSLAGAIDAWSCLVDPQVPRY